MRQLITVLVIVFVATTVARAGHEPPQLGASSAILMDAETGQVLYERNADERRPMASTTKIMTALVLLERGKLDSVCPVSKHASETPQASVYLEPGERLPLKDLLTAILVKSANDACVAAAENVAGSEAAFVELMNERAEQLGAHNTHFVNTNGLYAAEHYSTARDLATIARQALRNPRFARLVRTRYATLPWPSKGCDRVLINKNKLLTLMPGADGVKTGYVKESGHCLVASVTRGGWRLIAVMLNSPDLWSETPALLNYGFDNFRAVRFARRGEVAMTVPVNGGVRPRVGLAPSGTLMLVLPKSSRDVYEPRVELDRARISAPVRPGQKVGRMALTCAGRDIATVDLLASERVSRSLAANIRWGTTWFLFSLVAAAMMVRSYSVVTKKYRTRRLRVRLTPAQREPRSRASSQ